MNCRRSHYACVCVFNLKFFVFAFVYIQLRSFEINVNSRKCCCQRWQIQFYIRPERWQNTEYFYRFCFQIVCNTRSFQFWQKMDNERSVSNEPSVCVRSAHENDNEKLFLYQQAGIEVVVLVLIYCTDFKLVSCVILFCCVTWLSVFFLLFFSFHFSIP